MELLNRHTQAKAAASKSGKWIVRLTDDEIAERVAISRGWNRTLTRESHLLSVEPAEAEMAFRFRSLTDAMEFAQLSFSCDPPNWPTLDGPSGERGGFDGVDFWWDVAPS